MKPAKMNMRLYYQGKGLNFGDTLNYHLFKELFNCTVQSARPYDADFIAVGSVLDRVLYDTRKPALSRQNLKRRWSAITGKKRPIHVLGSGFIEDVRRTYPKLRPFRSLDVI